MRHQGASPSSIAAARMTSPARAVTARRASAFACRICLSSPAIRATGSGSRPGRPTGSATARCGTSAATPERLRFRQQRFPYPGFGSDLTIRCPPTWASMPRVRSRWLPPSSAERRTRHEEHQGCWRCRCRAGGGLPDSPAARRTGPGGTGPEAVRIIRSAFRDEGIAKVDRLDQDAANEACSRALGKEPAPEVVKAIEAANLKTIRPPGDGAKYLGDCGERREDRPEQARPDLHRRCQGRQWRQLLQLPPDQQAGNLLRHHRAEPVPVRPAAWRHRPGQPGGASDHRVHTWGKLWNARAYNACSHMPRAGHLGILSEAQIRHVMALLLDPKSPVNQ